MTTKKQRNTTRPKLTTASALFAVSSFAAPLFGQDPAPTHPFMLEESIDGGPWSQVPTTELRPLADGQIWLPFQDHSVNYRLRPATARAQAPGTAPPRPLSSAALTRSPEEGAFLTLRESEDLDTWRAVDSNVLTADHRGILVPLVGESGFWNLEIREQVPDPTPLPPLTIYPDPAASFQRTPWESATNGGVGGGGAYLDPFDGASDRHPLPGEHAFNQYIFEERVHQIFEGDVKGYGLVIASEDGFQAKVSGGLARDPNDGGLNMTTFRPGNVGSVAKLFSGVALMQLLQEQGPDLDTAMDQTIEDYLPPRWLPDVSNAHKAITFRMLLGHTSGISDIGISNNAPVNLQDNPDYFHFTQPLGGTQGCYEYANENYRIMTYLIPRLAYPNQMAAAHDANKNRSLDEYLDNVCEAHGLAFEEYMRDEFFPQIAGCAPSADPANDYPAGTTALMYSNPSDTAGLQWSQKEITGFARAQGGYWASAQEITRFMMSLMYSEDLLTTGNSDWLLRQGGGCNNPNDRWLITNGRAQHAGFDAELGANWWRSKPGRQPSNLSPGGTGRANAMFMPYGWVCAYVANSDTLSGDANSTSFGKILGAFYDATRDEPETISREAMSLTRFEDTTDYLRDHHMAVKWLDLYDIGGVPYVNAVYGDVPEPVAGRIGMNADAYQDFVDYWVKNKGFAIQQVESYLENGKIRYAAIITEEDRPEQRAYHGFDFNAHVAEGNALKNQGFVPVNVSVVSLNGVRRYTALYEKRSVKFQMRTWLDAQDYDDDFHDLGSDGYKVVSLNAYRHQGQRYYAAIWHQVGGGHVGIHEADRHAYRAADASNLNAGRLPTIITGFDSASQSEASSARHRFGAIWR